MLPKRLLGKTGQYLSIIGFGGILVAGVEQSEADAIVREAIDRGINYFDVAPTYGNAEEHLGPALEEFRKDVFLACKTTQRKKEGAIAELHESLRRLRTDHFDLYQLHSVNTKEDIEQIFAPGGAMEVFIEAREKGLTRYIGFSSHSVEAALELMDRFDFDTVLFPLNWVNFFNANFGPQVVAKAKSKNMGILALKAMARTQWAEGQKRTYSKCWYQPVTDPVESELAIRFTLSEPITAAVTPGHSDLFRRAVEVAGKFKPLSEAERAELRKRAEGLKPIFRLSDE